MSEGSEGSERELRGELEGCDRGVRGECQHEVTSNFMVPVTCACNAQTNSLQKVKY